MTKISFIWCFKLSLCSLKYQITDEKGKKVGYMDLLGRQTKVFGVGTYIIAVRAVDANMLNDIFTVKVKVNGGANVF